VFARRADRQAIERTAEAAGVPFLGLWLGAPEQVVVDRSRRRWADPSDADPAVVRAQLRAGAGEVAWHWIQTTAKPLDVLQDVLGVIDGRLKHEEASRTAGGRGLATELNR
jgi:predicted kinase